MERFTEKFKDERNILRKGITDIFHVGFGRFFEGEAINKLVDYEDLEEQGLLLRLPCKVGDTVYRICPKCNDNHNGNCKNCAWQGAAGMNGCNVYGLWSDGQYPPDKCTIVPYKVTWNYIPNFLENIGKTVFLTHEEAEAALEKTREENNNGR